MNKQLQSIENKLKQGGWYRIAFLGDSITSTEWVYPNWRGIMEFVLKEKLEEIMGEWEMPCWKIRCYNAGFNGATTREMIKYVDEEMAQYKPDMVIFMDTYNDKYINISPEEHENNLDVILKKLINLAETVVFTSSIARLTKEANERNEKYILEAGKIMEKYKSRVLTIDLFSQYSKLDLKKIFTFICVNGNSDAGIKPGEIDFSHPNQLGNAYIAKILLKEIFDIEFDAGLYIKDTLEGKKYPRY